MASIELRTPKNKPAYYKITANITLNGRTIRKFSRFEFDPKTLKTAKQRAAAATAAAFEFSAFPFVMRSALNAKKSLWLQRQFGNMCCSPTKCCTLQMSGIILYRLSSRSQKKEPALGL